MKTKVAVVLAVMATAGCLPGLAQSTAFTFQGRLNDTNGPVNGAYDMRFTLYDQLGGAGPQFILAPVLVTNGLFTVYVDFGAGYFTGSDRTVEVAVRPWPPFGAYTALSPRQPITPAPYAIFANGASNVTGRISVAQLPATVVTNGAAGINISGSFSGSGVGLTNVYYNAVVAPFTNNTIAGWGINGYSQLPIPANVTNPIAVAVGLGHCLAVNGDGTVVGWGVNLSAATPPLGLSNVIAVSAGEYNSLALRADGTIVEWGSDFVGIPNISASLTNAISVSTAWSHSLAALRNGTVVAWGNNQSGQTNVPTGLTGVIAVAAGTSHSMALKSNGTVVVWGDNSYGLTNVPANANQVVAIAAGDSHCLALKNDGTVVGWGNNLHGQTTIPAGLSNVVAVAATAFVSFALKNDGTVVAWGYSAGGQTAVPLTALNTVALAQGSQSSLELAIQRQTSPVAVLNHNNVFSGLNGFSGNTFFGGTSTFGGPAQFNGGIVGPVDFNGETDFFSSSYFWGPVQFSQAQFIGAISGFVGLNTNSPQQMLHLNVGAGMGEGMEIDSATAGHAPAIYLNHTGTGGLDFRLASYGDNSTPGHFAVRDENAAAERLTIDSTGTVGVPGPALSFGASTRQMLDLWGTQYGIGIQSYTMYFRVDSSSPGGGFAWYQGGTHSNTQNDPGAGGNIQMRLDSNGSLFTRGAVNPPSDRNLKQNFEPVNARDVLEKVAALAVKTWEYKSDTGTRHIGPVAQDFYAAFGVGTDDKHIATVDADGVALAAIQGLNRKVEDLKVELERRNTENGELRARLAAVEAMLRSLKSD